MGGFCIKPEKRKVNYGTGFFSRAVTVALAATAGTLLNSCWLFYITPPGITSYAASSSSQYSFETRKEMSDYIDTLLTNALPGNIIQHDIPLILSNNGDILTFRADGYISNLAISYKITTPLLNEDNGIPEYSIDESEWPMINIYQFYTNWIISLPSSGSNDVTYTIENFIYYYTSMTNI